MKSLVLAFAIVAAVASTGAAQPAPLFTCTLERSLAVMHPGQPQRPSIYTMTATGFVIDFESGIFRWRAREGTLTDPTRWTVTQRGIGGNDWVAARGLHDTARGDQQILRVRTWSPEHGTRFAIFDGLGQVLVGTCQQ